MPSVAGLREKMEVKMNENRCVCCGRIIPEGRQVCESCEAAAYYHEETPEDKAERIIWDWIIPAVVIGAVIAVYLFVRW